MIEVPDTVSTVTLYASLAHNDVYSYLQLYDETQVIKASSEGNSHSLNYTLTPGIYYLRTSTYSNQYSVSNSYKLELTTQ